MRLELDGGESSCAQLLRNIWASRATQQLACVALTHQFFATYHRPSLLLANGELTYSAFIKRCLPDAGRIMLGKDAVRDKSNEVAATPQRIAALGEKDGPPINQSRAPRSKCVLLRRARQPDRFRRDPSPHLETMRHR
jgi:hypothetical protein